MSKLKYTVIMMLVSLAVPVQAALIAASFPRFNDNFLDVLRQNIEVYIDETGNDTFFDQAEDNKDKQYAQVKRFTDAKVDALIVILVDSSKEYANKIIKLAADARIPLVFINTEPDVKPLPRGVVYVGSNELESGTLEMEELARQANYRGNVAILVGEESHPAAKARTLDVETVVKKYPNMKIILKESGEWQRNKGLEITKKWLKEHPNEINIIAANNDEMAIGAITALEEAGMRPKDILIGGVDATADALKAMKEGKLAATVLQDAPGQAREAAKAAVEMLSSPNKSGDIWVPFRLVSPDNLDQFTH